MKEKKTAMGNGMRSAVFVACKMTLLAGPFPPDPAISVSVSECAAAAPLSGFQTPIRTHLGIEVDDEGKA